MTAVRPEFGHVPPCLSGRSQRKMEIWPKLHFENTLRSLATTLTLFKPILTTLGPRGAMFIGTPVKVSSMV